MRIIKQKLRRWYDVYIRRDQRRIIFYKYLDDGGETLRSDYPLGTDSIVIDAGGYVGDFAADMVRKFGCKVDVFEPVKQYFDKTKERFESNNKITVIQAGFGGAEKEEFISIAGLGSSVFSGECAKEKIKIISAVDYIKSKDYSVVDLMKINIEGGEYELLDALLNYSELAKSVKYFQIQFHDFVPDAHRMRDEIRDKLSKTHDLMWDYPFIWESWKRKA